MLNEMKFSHPMERALSLAGLALGSTSPNPAVGAVIVKSGEVVGEGYTQPAGQAHAEVVALQQAGQAARGAELYVSLEPCCHYGRTPPCTRSIIEAGISAVHMAVIDPNPLVCGKGRAELEKAGIKTSVGYLEKEALELNEAYMKYITTGIPFVTAKFAMSLDGKIATWSGHSKYISCEESRRFVHTLRHNADAIMVGINTILLDDPHLTVRISFDGGTVIKQPLRVVVDSYGKTPLGAQILKEPGKTILAVAEDMEGGKIEAFQKKGAGVIKVPAVAGFLDLKTILAELGKREVTNLLVEGGGTLLGSFFDQGLVDKVAVFVAPMIIGGTTARSAVGGVGVERVQEARRLQEITISKFGEDVLIMGYLNRPEKYASCSLELSKK